MLEGGGPMEISLPVCTPDMYMDVLGNIVCNWQGAGWRRGPNSQMSINKRIVKLCYSTPQQRKLDDFHNYNVESEKNYRKICTITFYLYEI